jgi:transcription-repair coupling factor (superfamily II helicase)
MLTGWVPFNQAAKRFAEGDPCLRLAGLVGSARALVVAELLSAHPRPALVVASNLAEAHRWTQDLRFFGAPVSEFPEPEPSLWRAGHHREGDAERAFICRRLASGEPAVIVATLAALAAPLPRPADFAEAVLRIGGGDSLDRDLLVEALERGGYERVDSVIEVGQWSVRGGIVDVFSPAHGSPARVELFGDDVESIRLFDPTSQRSVAPLEELVVLPLRDVTDQDGARATLLDYLPPSAPVVVEDAKLLRERGEGRADSAEAPDGADDASALTLAERIAGRQTIVLRLVAGAAGTTLGAPAGELVLDTRSVDRFTGQFSRFTDELGRWRHEGFTIRLVASDERQADQLRQILHEHAIESVPVPTLRGVEPIGVLVGECTGGFTIPELGLIVLTEQEIFGARRRTLRRPKYQRGAALASFTDLTLGDLIVHEDHGIGRYLGLKTMSVGDRDADFLLLEYADGNQLYLPVDRLDLISKYLGGDAGAARLDRLGGASWQRVKESVRAALREMADELLQLYARRALASGHACSGDQAWQREFEAAFRWEETPDQLRAIEEVKRDMERQTPMDRLVAGDVGYGKTEVALRAAFKAVADGLQVAVLVPTTVLAHQHWTTFSERFGPFPTRVELLSRFRSAKEQKAVVEGLKQGTVDVVIGTHRLLSKDVQFKNLGLLIVDEEHRFGVSHKERVKQLRTSVDVLSLTATPIPRTLYMALSGVRDMSVIQTPPADRLPVETIIRRFSKKVIKEVLERELERGGQVFFVHNRVQSLPSMVRFIQEMVPEARVVMGHGQMGERELEAAMVKFTTGQADVLVSTAIVESGLDIPASNTIIVNRADRFGLAQLYQLRGRVGRERQQAYAYFLVPADGRVDEQAQRRLRALQELTELGSGFKLALRDLEIRGAGNLLGPEQHGHIAAVGYDLYSKLLGEAVRELSGRVAGAESTADARVAAPAVEPVITADVEAYLPEEYVPEVNQRLVLYKRLTGAVSRDAVSDLRAELADRFGPLPPPAEQLLDVVAVRVAARPLGIEKVEAGGGKVLITFSAVTPLDPSRLLRAIHESKGRLRMRGEFTLEAAIAGHSDGPAGHSDGPPRDGWPAVRNSLLCLFADLANLA